MARSSSSGGHLDKHLKDPFTTRDLLGVCRGRCVSKTCPGCPGGYLKRTADYYAKPPPLDPRAFAEETWKHAREEANRPEAAERESTERKVHPDNDPTLTRCSRCGCSSIDHEVAHADDARARGNDAFATGELRAAIAAYSQALAAAPGDAKAYSNRAAAILALGENPGGALEDARRAARIEPEWAKARVRQGEALKALGRHEEAARAYAVAAKLDPSYRDAAAEAAAKASRADQTKREDDASAKSRPKRTHARPAERVLSSSRTSSETTRSNPASTMTPSVPMPTSAAVSSESATRVPPGDAAEAARVACERLAASVAAAARAAQAVEDTSRSAASRRDALLGEIRELEAQKARVAKTVAALHSEARAARDAAATASRAPRADGETQTSEDGTAEDADVPEIANELPGTPPEAEEAHATTREEDEEEEEDKDEDEVAEGTRNVDASSPPSEDKTSETLRFFESFRAAFGDADDGGEGPPTPVDETDALGALEEWAEKWEREQWDRRNASAPSAERGAQAGDKRARKKKAGVSSSSAKSSRVDASGLAELLAASSRPSLGDKDHENRARGPCRSCISRADPAARCFSFASLSGWRARGAEALAPLARASPEDAAASAQAFGCVAVSAHAFARAAAASRVEAARDGALCARCGCSAESHASRQDTSRMLRRSSAARDAAAEEESARLLRVATCASRVREARERGELIRETHADAVSGAERAGCERCGPTRCRRFRCAFAELDATNPECVLFCSDCGCAAANHPVSAEWAKRNDEKIAAQAQAHARAKAAAQAARDARARRRGADDAAASLLASDLAALGLGSESESVGAHALARAYKKAALRWHPDKKGGDAEKFVAAAEAFRRLRERASGAG